MAFRKKYINEIIGTVLVLSGLLSTASAVDCYGKSFHCVNSTHFMICVDLGGGVSQSIDNFLIACPPPTVCQGNNHFECEFPAVTTLSTTLSNAIIETTQPWEDIVVTTNSPSANTTKEYSEKYMNTVSITTLAEDSFTTDATVDITTVVSSSNDVNSNSQVTDAVPTSVIGDITTEYNVITPPDNIVMGAANATTENGQVKPLNQKQNVTNETFLNEANNDNITLSTSVTEPMITMILNNSVVSNDNINFTGDIKNGTLKSEVGNVTIGFGPVSTPDTLILDYSIDAEQPLTTTISESLVTGSNLEVTTAQSSVSTDAFIHTANINVGATSTETAIVKNRFGIPDNPVFQENITTDTVLNLATEQSTIFTTDVQNVPDQLPITTYQSTMTEYTVTSKSIKDEVTQPNVGITVETTDGSKQPTTTINKENFSTEVTTEKLSVFTTETQELLGTEQTIINKNSLATDIDVTTEKPSIFTTETHKIQSTEPPITNKNSLVTDIDVTTEKSSAFTTKTQKPLSTEQPATNKNSLVTDIDVTTEKPSAFTTETQKLIGTEQIATNKNNLATDIDVTTEKTSAFTTQTQKLQPATNKNSLATDIVVLTEIPSDFTTEIQKLLGTEQPTTNKNSLATDIVVPTEILKVLTTRTQELLSTEQPITNNNSLGTDIDVTTEKPSAFTTETQKLQSTEQLTTNIISLATDIDVTTDKSFTTETQKPLGTEQPATNKNSIEIDINVTTEKSRVFTTETQKLLGTEQTATNKNNLTTDIDVTTEKTSAFTTETQKLSTEQPTTNTISLATDIVVPTDTLNVLTTRTQLLGTEQPATNKISSATDIVVLTEIPSDFTTEIQKLLGTEQPTTNKNSLATDIVVPTDTLNVFTTRTQELLSTEQPTTNNNSLATDIDVRTEKPSAFTTETQKLLSTEQLTTNIISLTTDIDVTTEKPSAFTTDTQKTLDTEQPATNKNSLETDIDVTTEKPRVFTTETQRLLSTEQLTTNIISLATDVDVTTEKSSAFTTQTQKPLSTEQSATNKNSLVTDIDVTTEKPSVFTTETQKPQGTEQPATNKNSLVIDINVTSEKSSAFTTETQKSLIIEQPATNKTSLATDIDVATEKPSVFTTETQKLLVTDTEQSATNKNSLVINIDVTTEKPSAFTMETQKLLGTEQPATNENSLVTDIDVTTEKPSAFTTETQKLLGTEQSTTNNKSLGTDIDVTTEKPSAVAIETQKLLGTEQPTTNKNSLATDIDVTTGTLNVFTTETQALLGTEQPVTNKNRLGTDIDVTTETLNVFIPGTQELLGIEQPTTNENNLATDIEVTTEKSSAFTTERQNLLGTEQLATNKNSLATDIVVPTEIPSVFATVTQNSKIQIDEEAAAFTNASLSEQIAITGQKEQKISTTETTVNLETKNATISEKDLDPDARTDVVTVHGTGFTEKPIATAIEVSTVTNASVLTNKGTIFNTTKHQNITTSKNNANVTEVVQSIPITTTTLRTQNLIEDSYISLNTEMTKETPTDLNGKANDINIVSQIPFQGTTGVTDSLISTTVTSVDDNNKIVYETSTSEITLSLNYGTNEITQSTHTNVAYSTNGVSSNISPNVADEINVPVIDHSSSININNKVVTSPSRISEANDSSQFTVKQTTDIQSVFENVVKNKQMTEGNLKVVTNLAINDHKLNTDTDNSKITTKERVTVIQAEDVGGQGVKQLPTPITVDLETESTSNLNSVNILLDSSLHQKMYNKAKKSNSSYSGQFSKAEVTSETTATENFTPSLNPISDHAQLTKYVTTSHQVSTENANIAIDNLADSTSAFTTATNTILKLKNNDLNVLPTENSNLDNTLTSFNTEHNLYAILTTEKTVTFHDNVANNQDPQNVKPSHETTQVSPQMNDVKHSSMYNVNHDAENGTTTKRVFGNTEKALTKKSTSIGEIGFEVHTSNKNKIIQQVETTTEIINNSQTKPNVAMINSVNVNNFLSNSLSNVLLDKINQATRPKKEASVYFTGENDGNINNMSTSTDTLSITDDSFAHYNEVSSVRTSNDITTQGFIPLLPTSNVLPSMRHDNDSLLVPDKLQKTDETTSMTGTEKLHVIPPDTTLINYFSLKEEPLINGGNDIASSTVPMTESTTEFSTYTVGNTNIDANSDISHIQSSHGVLDASKTSSKIESSLIGQNDHINSLITKLAPHLTGANILPSVTYRPIRTDDYSITTKLETSTEAIKNSTEATLQEPAISEALPVSLYEIRINTAKINEPIQNASYDVETSETKISNKPYNSVTSHPGKVTFSTIDTYQYDGDETSDVITVTSSHAASIPPNETYSVGSSSSQQQVGNAVKADANNLPENMHVTQNNEQNVTVRNILLNNSVRLGTNTTEAKENEANGSKISNSFIGDRKIYQGKHSTITASLPKNVSQSTGINKNGSSVQSSTNTTKFYKQGDLNSKQKTSVNYTRYIQGQDKTTKTPEHKIIHSVTITTPAPIRRVTPRPVSPTTENPRKQSSKTVVVNHSCINGIRGRYSDKDDCRKFYICIGNNQPLVGNCPVNTVFSDISKLCTKNLSHCIRENEFKCPSVGRFSDVIKDNVYYICVDYKTHLYRFKFQCQKGFTLNKTITRCIENKEIESNESVSISLSENSSDGSSGSETTSSSTSSSSTSSGSSSDSRSSSSSSNSKDSSSSGDSANNSDSSTSKSKKNKEKKENKEKPEGKEEGDEDEVFECEKEGKFPVRNDCRRYYLCKKNGKSEYRRKIKKCESGDVFHKKKKNSKNSSSSDSGNNSHSSASGRRKNREKKEKPEGKKREHEHEVFKCEKEGKYPVPDDCRRYYLCKRSRKSEYRRKIKKCDSGELFDKSKKKCVDADSYKC